MIQSIVRCHCQCIIRKEGVETKVCLSNQEGSGRKLQTTYISVMSNLPLAPDTVMKLIKCNCKKSNWRTRKCICKKAKLYYTTFFTFFLDNDVVCENQDINDKRIVDTSQCWGLDECFSQVLLLYKNQLFDFQCKSKSFFLSNGNFGLK